MSLADPLLERSSSRDSKATNSSDEGPPRIRVGQRQVACLLSGALCVYVLLGAFERVSFSRMVQAMPNGILLMHTLLALMSLLFFSVLQLARSQSNGPTVSEQLQQLHMPDVLSMAVLDVLHSLLALIGATVIPGVVQAMLVYSSVPAVALFSSLLVPETYQLIGSVLIAIAVTLVVLAPHPSADRLLRMTAMTIKRLLLPESLDEGDPVQQQQQQQQQQQMPTPLVLDGFAPFTPMGPAPPGSNLPAMPLVDGRILFFIGGLLSALSAAHKRRCLTRHPADLLVLNTCLSGVSVLVGLVLGPPLLLLLYMHPVRDTLLQLARGLRCFMSGFNANICVDNRDAFGTPNLLTFFVVSTAWNATTFGLLRLGGESHLALGGALIFPMTLLAFIRPVPLPYAWAAPPEPLSPQETVLAVALTLALAIYHGASFMLLRRWSGTAGRMRLPPTGPGRDSGVGPDSSPGFVGPALHL